jgi:hypothetical protein
MNWPYGIILDRHVYVYASGGIETWLLDDIELMQFTEMQDSHGHDIYDGDIVEINQPYETIHAPVFWGEVTNSYQWICGQTWLFRFSNGTQGPVLPYLRYGYELRVIGNIYEQPHLLE